MPKYDVNKDGADEALDPQSTNAKVSFNNKDTNSERKNTRTKNVVVLVLVAVCIIAVVLLCAWFIYTMIDTGSESQREYLHIETIPGLHYHPALQDTGNMIAFNQTNSESVIKWVDVIYSELKDYLDRSPSNRVPCDYDKPPQGGEVCAQDIINWFPCILSNNYGYNKASPCVFIRFKKIVDWSPEFYEMPNSFPEDMPDDLKSTIRRERHLFYKLARTVWLSCRGVDHADEDNMGTIRYIPKMGFPGFFFPYNNTKNYLSPLVAVHFEKPVKGVVINVECRVWAKNMEYNKENGSGHVTFQLRVDK